MSGEDLENIAGVTRGYRCRGSLGVQYVVGTLAAPVESSGGGIDPWIDTFHQVKDRRFDGGGASNCPSSLAVVKSFGRLQGVGPGVAVEQAGRHSFQSIGVPSAPRLRRTVVEGVGIQDGTYFISQQAGERCWLDPGHHGLSIG